MPTAKELRYPPSTFLPVVEHYLDYSPGYGVFTWLVATRRTAAFSLAGRVTWKGYRYISFENTAFLASRLAWFMVRHEWPEHEIDHINGDRDDNRFLNLRQATRQQNVQNSGMPRTNTSGVKGVRWDERNNAWRATMTADGESIFLGYHSSIIAAARAYNEASKKAKGEFYRPVNERILP